MIFETQSLDKPIFDLCSPSCTGVGFEILRTVPLIKAAKSAGWHVRLWTFHPLAFDDNVIDLIPLQQGYLPLLPKVHTPDSQKNMGVVWMPHNHSDGPYVCRRALSAAQSRGFLLLNGDISNTLPGSYPTLVNNLALKLFNIDQTNNPKTGCPLSPAQQDPTIQPSIILNLIGAHGTEKGLSDTETACIIANDIGQKFSKFNFTLLLNARVCAGQSFNITAPNVKILIHLDSDSRVSKILHHNTLTITIEGGLAHSVIYRNGLLALIGQEKWLRQTAYLYPSNTNNSYNIISSFSINDLTRIITTILNKYIIL